MPMILQIYRTASALWSGQLLVGGKELRFLQVFATPESVEQAFIKLGFHSECVEVEAT
jgi:hypothetical protein